MPDVRPVFYRLLLVFALLFVAGPAIAEQVQLVANRDTTIFSDAPSNANGGNASVLAGATKPVGAGDTPTRRALLGFDLSAIPSGATITSVQLTLTITRQGLRGATTRDLFAVYRVQSDWGEGSANAAGLPTSGFGAAAAVGDATWDESFFQTTAWSMAGGDLAGSASGTQVSDVLVDNAGGTTPITWTGPGLAGDVQAWLDDPSSNFGWAIVGDPGNPQQSARLFGSRESAFAPVLTVQYTPAPEPGSLAIATLVGGLLLRRRRGSIAVDR